MFQNLLICGPLFLLLVQQGNPKGVELSYLALDSTKIITEQVNPLKIDFSGNNDFISYLPLNHIAESE